MDRPMHDRLIVDEVGLRMEQPGGKPIIDVTAEYARASKASRDFNPGDQPNIKELMVAAFMHGYAQALIDARPTSSGEGK